MAPVSTIILRATRTPNFETILLNILLSPYRHRKRNYFRLRDPEKSRVSRLADHTHYAVIEKGRKTHTLSGIVMGKMLENS